MSIKLIILGLLMEQNRHPYDIRQTMKERKMNHYIKFKDGSLYYAFEQLAKVGCIQVVETVRDGTRPDRTVYAITPEGKTYFQQLLMDHFRQMAEVNNPMYAALSFAMHGDDQEIAEVLEAKIITYREIVQTWKRLYEEYTPIVPRGVLHMMMNSYEHAQTELNWMERLLKDVKQGKLKERGQPLDS